MLVAVKFNLPIAMDVIHMHVAIFQIWVFTNIYDNWGVLLQNVSVCIQKAPFAFSAFSERRGLQG